MSLHTKTVFITAIIVFGLLLFGCVSNSGTNQAIANNSNNPEVGSPNNQTINEVPETDRLGVRKVENILTKEYSSESENSSIRVTYNKLLKTASVEVNSYFNESGDTQFLKQRNFLKSQFGQLLCLIPAMIANINNQTYLDNVASAFNTTRESTKAPSTELSRDLEQSHVITATVYTFIKGDPVYVSKCTVVTGQPVQFTVNPLAS